jgi:Cu2+-exporting ATPase
MSPPIPTLDDSPRSTTPPPAARPTCRHCGSVNPPASEFCCAGCAYVFRLVHEHGLDAYYKIKDTVTTPADPAVFQARDYAWLGELQVQAEAKAGEATPQLDLGIQGISCAACVWLIEHLARQQPGARQVLVNAQTGVLRLRWTRGEFDAADFGRRLQAFNYLVGPAHGSAHEGAESRALARRIGLCAAFSMNIMLFTLPSYFGMESTFAYAGLFNALSMAFATLTLFTGGFYFLDRAARALRAGAMHIDLPIAVGILGSYAGSLYGWLTDQEHFIYFDFVGTFVVLMLVGRWAQVAAVERNRRRLLSRQPKAPQVRVLAADGVERNVEPEALGTDDAYRLSAGQTLPVESRLETTEAAFSLASINGEAEPRIFRRGQRVPAGAVNLNFGDVDVVALQPWAESLLAELLKPGQREGHRQVVLERIVRGYLIGIFVIATAAGVGWWLATQDGPRTWAVVTAVLVVSCPCAIGLSFPLADEMATVALRRRGVFVREGDLYSRLSKVKRLIFDKTGTLTLEAPVLRNPEVLATLDASEQAALLALVRDNPHPVAQALLEPLLARAGDVADLGALEESVGHGVEAGPWSLGKSGWRAGQTGETGTVFAHGGQVRARFEFADLVRTDAREVIARLARRSLPSFILSGDRRDKVERMAVDLGLPSECALGELTPQDKAAWLDREAAGTALMLGDGANDSLAFDRALCRGTPVIHRGVLAQKADFYYLGKGLSGLQALFAVNDTRMRTQTALLVFSVVYNLMAVGMAVAGHMNPLVAAVIMPVSSLASLAIVGVGMRSAWSSQS